MSATTPPHEAALPLLDETTRHPDGEAARLRADENAANARAELEAAVHRHQAPADAYALAHAQAATAALHAQAVAVINFKTLVPIVLDTNSPHYNKWRGLFLNTLNKYALEDHVLSNDNLSDDVAWKRMDATVLSWIYTTLTNDVLDIVMTPSSLARTVWLAIEQQFLGNKETRALLLDAEFQIFAQGNLSITDYCRKMKAMADALGDLGEPVLDRTLVLSVLRGLNEKFATVASLIKRQKPFPSFVEVRSDLLLEEITMQSTPGASSTALIAAATTSTPPPPASSNNSNQGSGPGSSSGSRRNRRRNRGSGSNGGSSGAPPPWLSYYNPWTGLIQMWPGPQQPQQRPAGPQRQANEPARGTAPSFSMLACVPPMQPGFPPPGGHPVYPSVAPLPGVPGAWPPVPAGVPGAWPLGVATWDQPALAYAFQTMTLTSPLSTDWYFDSRATSQMTSNSGSQNQERDRQCNSTGPLYPLQPSASTSHPCALAASGVSSLGIVASVTLDTKPSLD